MTFNSSMFPVLIVLIISALCQAKLFDPPKDLNATLTPINDAISEIGKETSALYEEVVDNSFLLKIHQTLVVPLVDAEKKLARAFLKYEACKKIFFHESVLKKVHDKVEKVLEAKPSEESSSFFHRPSIFHDVLPDIHGKLFNGTVFESIKEDLKGPIERVKHRLDNVKEKLGVPEIKQHLADRVESVKTALANIGDRIDSLYKNIQDNSVVLSFHRYVVKPVIKLEKDLIIIHHKFVACQNIILEGDDNIFKRFKQGFTALNPFKNIKHPQLLFGPKPDLSMLTNVDKIVPENPVNFLPTVPTLPKPTGLLPNLKPGKDDDQHRPDNERPVKPLDLTPVDVLEHHKVSPPPSEPEPQEKSLFPHLRPGKIGLFRH